MNDSMPKYVSGEIIRIMESKEINVKKATSLFWELLFKENCPDIRNSKVFEMIKF